MKTVHHRRGAWRAPGSHLARLRDPVDHDEPTSASTAWLPPSHRDPGPCTGDEAVAAGALERPGTRIDHEALSQIFFVDELELGNHAALARAIETGCARELGALLPSSALRVRAAGARSHRREPIFTTARIKVTGWVEQLGDREVVFRVVATAASVEVLDASLRYELIVAPPARGRSRR